MPAAVERLARKYLRKPANVTIGIAGEAVDTVEQRVEFINSDDKKNARMKEILKYGGFAPPMVRFVAQAIQRSLLTDLRLYSSTKNEQQIRSSSMSTKLVYRVPHCIPTRRRISERRPFSLSRTDWSRYSSPLMWLVVVSIFPTFVSTSHLLRDALLTSAALVLNWAAAGDIERHTHRLYHSYFGDTVDR